MALYAAGIHCELREVALKHKPQAMLELSAKGTVPVLLLADGTVIDESLDIMLRALSESDPLQWLKPAHGSVHEMLELIRFNDHEFKFHLDRYKYPERFETVSPAVDHFHHASGFLYMLEASLQQSKFLFGPEASLADVALFPFVRQFAAVDQQAFEKLPCPHLQQWLAYWLADSAFQAVMCKQKVWQAGSSPVFLC